MFKLIKFTFKLGVLVALVAAVAKYVDVNKEN